MCGPHCAKESALHKYKGVTGEGRGHEKIEIGSLQGLELLEAYRGGHEEEG